MSGQSKIANGSLIKSVAHLTSTPAFCLSLSCAILSLISLVYRC